MTTLWPHLINFTRDNFEKKWENAPPLFSKVRMTFFIQLKYFQKFLKLQRILNILPKVLKDSLWRQFSIDWQHI